MRYYALTFPNHNTLVVTHELPIVQVLNLLSTKNGIVSSSGTIYNPKSFLTLSFINEPDKRQRLVAQELEKVLV